MQGVSSGQLEGFFLLKLYSGIHNLRPTWPIQCCLPELGFLVSIPTVFHVVWHLLTEDYLTEDWKLLCEGQIMYASCMVYWVILCQKERK